jgi:predicted secreted Zn-dependent protease
MLKMMAVGPYIKVINPICRSLFLAPLIVTAIIGGMISAVHAAPRIKVTEKYYSIHGHTADELRQQLNKYGVKTEKGEPHDAVTRWYVKWRFGVSSKGGRCIIRDVKTSADVIYTLPKWTDEAKAPQELRNRWHRYQRALKKHEDGHRDIGVSAAAEIEQAIGTLGSEVNCRSLEGKANALGESILEKFRHKEWTYDILTGHGMTQGAVFR